VEDQQRVLLAELDHRVKNTLATVSAVVAHSLDGSELICATALNGRIRAMATTHELLSACRWQGVSLKELVRRELAPYASGDNSEFRGPDVLLHAEAAQAMSMRRKVRRTIEQGWARVGPMGAADEKVSSGGGLAGDRRSSGCRSW